MNRKCSLYGLLLFSSFLIQTAVYAQGLYPRFGENRVTYKQIVWEHFTFAGNDELIVERGQQFLANTMIDQINRERKNLQRELNYALRGNIKIVVFSNFTDYIQSNFGITNHQFYAGGYIYTPHNDIFVYFNGNYNALLRQIKEGIARSIINEMLLGGTMLERAQSSALFTVPTWFSEGLASYLAEPWSTERDNTMRDAVQTQKLKNFTFAEKDVEVFAGHSLWYFIDQRFGRNVLRNILFHTRYARSPEAAIATYTELGMNALINEWNDFFKSRYAPEQEHFVLPLGAESKLKKQSKQLHTGLSISPDGKKVAFVTHNRGRYKVWIYNTQNKQTKVLLRGGFKTYTRMPNYLFPVVKWRNQHSVDVLAEQKGKIYLVTYDANSGNENGRLSFDSFDWINDFAFSPFDNSLAIAALKNGMANVFVFNANSKKPVQITNNMFDVRDLCFTQEGNLLYVSNQPGPQTSETSFLNFYAAYGVFYYNSSTGKSTRVTPVDHHVQYKNPVHVGGDYISFLSDMNGIFNSYVASFNGKTLEYKDLSQLTNYQRSILSQQVSIESATVAELLFYNGTYRIFISPYNLQNPVQDQLQDRSKLTFYRRQNQPTITPPAQQPIPDSPPLPEHKDTAATPLPVTPTKDTLLQFDFQSHFPVIDFIDTKKTMEEHKDSIKTPEEHPPLFKIDYLLVRLFDNAIVEDYYFQGNVAQEVMNTPLFSPHASLSVSDMFNNHVLEANLRMAGLAFTGKLYGAEYALRYKNRVRKWNKEIYFLRRGRFMDRDPSFENNVMMKGGVQFNYPLSEKARLELGSYFRQDKQSFKAIDEASLIKNNEEQHLLAFKAAYVFDNTVSRGLNMMHGTRMKFFLEQVSRVGQTKGSNFMLGADIRNYTPLFRQLIWANRFAGNASLGTAKTAYFLGGPENWYMQTYDNEVGRVADESTMFQSIGAPVRGFLRNTRSGNAYLVLNSELRLPLFPFLVQKPLRNEMLRSFTLVGFLDVATAWVGNSPFSPGNPYNTIFFNNPSVDVSVTANRNPFIIGTGMGARIKVDSYFIKYDAAYGFVEDQPAMLMHHFSLGLDF